MAYSWSNTASTSFRPEAFSGKFDLSKSAGGTVVFPWLAAATLGSGALSAFTGKGAADTQANIAQANLAFGADQLKNQILFSRDQAKAGLASMLGQQNAQFGWGSDTEAQRQFDAARRQRMFLDPMDLAMDTDRARRQFDLSSSAQAREVGQRENREALKRSIVERQAALAGAFGKIAPQITTEIAV